MKIAWLIKMDSDDEWDIVFTEPDARFYHAVRMIAYSVLETGEKPK